jgi:hypothetical protein
MSSSSKVPTNFREYTQAEVQTNDLLLIVDLANYELKKIKVDEFSRYATSVNGTYTGSYSGSLTGSLLGTASWAVNALTASYIAGGVTNASNIGTSGVNVFSGKIGSILTFKSIVAGTNITLNENTTTKTITINAADSIVNPDGIPGAIQFKSSLGGFLGSSNFVWDNTNNVLRIQNGNITASYLYGTASYSQNSISASFSETARSSSYALTSSFASGSRSSSYAATASYLAGSQTAVNTSGLFAWPAGGATTTHPHALLVVPKIYRWVAYCLVSDATYTAGVELDLNSFFQANGFDDDDTIPAFAVYADGTNIYATKSTYFSNYVIGASGIPVTYLASSWRLKCYVVAS